MIRPKKEDYCKSDITPQGLKPCWDTFDVNAYSIATDQYIDYLESEKASDISVISRRYSWDELNELREFVKAQREITLAHYEDSQSAIAIRSFALVANVLCGVMDEITKMLEIYNGD